MKKNKNLKEMMNKHITFPITIKTLANQIKIKH